MNKLTSKGTNMDIEIYSDFSFYMLYPISTEGSLWIEENVDSDEVTHFGGGIPVEHRYVQELTAGALEAGLSVLVDGYEVYLTPDGEIYRFTRKSEGVNIV
jgi:hypothetical protein